MLTRGLKNPMHSYALYAKVCSTLCCKVFTLCAWNIILTTKIQDIYDKKKRSSKTSVLMTIIQVHEFRKTWKP